MTNFSRILLLILPAGLAFALVFSHSPRTATGSEESDFSTSVQPLIKAHCLNCHSTKSKKGELDLERFATLDDVRKDLKPWQAMIEQVETGEMPPRDKPQPSAEEKKKLVSWIRKLIDTEKAKRKGDPGFVPLRRLSNAEYNATIRDLTGVDLQPAREFPADGAAGEGFTNAAEALTDVSPALFTKYLNAARTISQHVVLLPDGIRFSSKATRRDWSDEGVAALRAFYAKYAPADGHLDARPYLHATIKYRAQLQAGNFDTIAKQEKLNAKYLGFLWKTLSANVRSEPLYSIQKRWQTASDADAPALAAEIEAWQKALWKTARVGSYSRPEGTGYTVNLSRQFPAEPIIVPSQRIRVPVKVQPGQSDVTLHLSAAEFVNGPAPAEIVWQNARFESAGAEPLFLKDYAAYGPRFEFDFASVFSKTDHYLAAALEAAKNPKTNIDELARRHSLHAGVLKRWIDFLALDLDGRKASEGKPVPFVDLTLLDTKAERIDGRPGLSGWHGRTAGLPVVMSNATDAELLIPGRASAHSVVVHPMPKECVGVVWTSPIDGEIQWSARIEHAHPNCGNGIAWWVEHRSGKRAFQLDEGKLDLGKSHQTAARTKTIAKGEQMILVVDARDANHFCDLTQIALKITETKKPERVWDLTADVANSLLDGNPHADQHGNKTVWSFVKGPTRAVAGRELPIPEQSALGQWKTAAGDAKKHSELPKLASAVKDLLSGARPAAEKDPNRILFDSLVTVDGPLLKAIDATELAVKSSTKPFGLPADRFDSEGKLIVASDKSLAIRLPAALFVGREFVVVGSLQQETTARVARLSVSDHANTASRWDGQSPLVATPDRAGTNQLKKGWGAFSTVFPLYLCYPQVIPTDEVVSLKMFHREDEPLIRLFLSDEEQQTLDKLWSVHLFVSRQAILENAYLPQFIGFVTQDQPKSMVSFYEGQRPAFQERADAATKREKEAQPSHRNAVLAFAERAYRKPLQPTERDDLLNLYRSILKNGASHEEAIRGMIQRILIAPAFLFRIEHAPAGTKPQPVSDWELATRLSYFLWSSLPDDELRTLAKEGRLREPGVIEAQMRRMLADPRARALAIEYGTQWIHVRGFDSHNEKNESLFPSFTPELRAALYEEAILLFQDFFQTNRSITTLLDSDSTFLNETLAKHYGIPDVSGPEWRAVSGVKRHGRGGLLGLGSVQTMQSGASRTSPVLRGNWIVETLLGEKLPRPPANVPKLPEQDGTAELTTRQLVERHVSEASCATCHQRIDPYGFALEAFDPIGRHRSKDSLNRPIDSHAKLRDGTEFEGIDGLRDYLMTKKRDVIVRLFCKRLLGYALGRSTTLSDTALIDEMVYALNASEGRIHSALIVILNSPQFQQIRGADFVE